MLKKSFLDSIEVQTPCLQKWDEMRGSDQIRFCDHCAKDVHNLSRFTRKDARKLIAASNGGICVQYVRRPDGRIQTLKKQLHQITRQTGITAGVLGTSLSISTAAFAQTPTDNNQIADAPIVELSVLKTDSPTGAISGTITDPNGAVIPFALVTIINEQTNFYKSANSNQEGFYEFTDVPDGIYKLKIEAGGFESKETAEVSVGAGRAETQDAQLAVQTVQAEVIIDNGEGTGEGAGVGYGMGGAISICNFPENQLVQAVENDNLEEVKVRVSMGERVNSKDKCYSGNSPLHVAVENGNLEIAEVLLNAGAKPNSKNFDKRTPLMMLDEDAKPELVNLLLRHGAKTNQADREGNTALILAAAYSEKDVVQTLISAGANVNAVNKQGETALMNAAENGETEIVQLLLGAGANANARNRDGETALNMVKNEEAKQYLIAYGATR